MIRVVSEMPRDVEGVGIQECFCCGPVFRVFTPAALASRDKKIENNPEIPTDPTRNASLWYPLPHHFVNYVR